jgi:hypothetical protein
VDEIRILAQEGPVNLDKLFNKAALNVIWNLVSGTRYGYHDQRMHYLLGRRKNPSGLLS